MSKEQQKIIGFSLLVAIMLLALVGTLGSAVTSTQIQEPDRDPNLCCCHKENGVPSMTKCLPNAKAYDSHIDHGDSAGPCAEAATNTPTTVPATPPTPIVTPSATPTNTPTTYAPTVTSVSPTATPTATPVATTVTTATPTATPQGENTTIITPTATTAWVFLPTAPAPVPTTDTCDLCTAQEASLFADARLKNTLSDVLDALFFNDLVPEFMQRWFERQ